MATMAVIAQKRLIVREEDSPLVEARKCGEEGVVLVLDHAGSQGRR